MKSRRRIAFLRLETTPNLACNSDDQNRNLQATKQGGNGSICAAAILSRPRSVGSCAEKLSLSMLSLLQPPEADVDADIQRPPLGAISRPMRCSKRAQASSIGDTSRPIRRSGRYGTSMPPPNVIPA
jgi:hypothetical protein